MEHVDGFITFLERKGVDPDTVKLHGLTEDEEKSLIFGQFNLAQTPWSQEDFISYLDLYLWEYTGDSSYRIADAWLKLATGNGRNYLRPAFTLEDVISTTLLSRVYDNIERELEELIETSDEEPQAKKPFVINWFIVGAFLFVGFMICFFLAGI